MKKHFNYFILFCLTAANCFIAIPLSLATSSTSSINGEAIVLDENQELIAEVDNEEVESEKAKAETQNILDLPQIMPMSAKTHTYNEDVVIVARNILTKTQTNITLRNNFTEIYETSSISPRQNPIKSSNADWSRFNPNAIEYRQRTTAYLEAVYYNVPSQNKGPQTRRTYCSSGLIGPKGIITAAHCLFNDMTNEEMDGINFQDGIWNPRFPDVVNVIPGLNGTQVPFGSARVMNVYIQKAFYDAPNPTIFTDNTPYWIYDWALAELDWEIGNIAGWNDFNPVFYALDSYIRLTGYPSLYPGELWETRGYSIRVTQNVIEFDAFSWHGFSGGPLIVRDYKDDYLIVGVNSNIEGRNMQNVSITRARAVKTGFFIRYVRDVFLPLPIVDDDYM